MFALLTLIPSDRIATIPKNTGFAAQGRSYGTGATGSTGSDAALAVSSRRWRLVGIRLRQGYGTGSGAALAEVGSEVGSGDAGKEDSGVVDGEASAVGDSGTGWV
ncbi:MAG: hypothetical protein LBU38_03520, partial [Propionibacteriaceae bacterium]|nr:hypothetical protein [Propionibacteriaceae bacterium]